MTGKNHIGFALSSKGESTFQAVDPANGQLMDPYFYSANVDEINTAVDLAVSAFPLFSRLSISRRAKFIREIGVEILNDSDSILARYVCESGLSKLRGQAELRRTVFQLNSYAEALLKGEILGLSIDFADDQVVPPRPDLRKMNMAIGPVVVFGASNFPLAYSTAGGDTASAFAAGCPVIVKAHPLHPGTSELVATCIARAAKRTDMPEGVFSHLLDSGFEVGQQLVMHSGIKAVGFTGSFRGGMALAELANKRKEPIPVFAEMGSVNPLIILPSVLSLEMDDVTTKIAHSVTNDAGQFCTKPGIVFLERGQKMDQVALELIRKIKNTEPKTMLGAEIHSAFNSGIDAFSKLLEYQASLTEEAIPYGSAAPAAFEIDQDRFMQEERFYQELFGPYTLIVRYKDDKGLHACLNRLRGQLTCAVFGAVEELRSQTELLILLQENAGRVIVNGVPTGVSVCPSMHHGGPYPATTDARFSAVGSDAIARFLRPVCFQNYPQELLPEVLRDINMYNLYRRVNGELCKDHVVHKKD
jgi:alpha-ketoglutaric semialdehyde dehydrogenase